MKTIFEYIAYVIAGILILDFVCFVAWVMSGQTPVDGFYFGMITANVLKLII